MIIVWAWSLWAKCGNSLWPLKVVPGGLGADKWKGTLRDNCFSFIRFPLLTPNPEAERKKAKGSCQVVWPGHQDRQSFPDDSNQEAKAQKLPKLSSSAIKELSAVSSHGTIV